MRAASARRYIATGHYARLEQRADGPHLFRGTPRQGPGLRPGPARPRAARRACCCRSASSTRPRRARTPNGSACSVADKTESQDICFVEGGDYRDILARVAPATMAPGEIRTSRGRARRRARRHRELHRRPAPRPARQHRRGTALRDAHRSGDEHDRRRPRRRTRRLRTRRRRGQPDPARTLRERRGARARDDALPPDAGARAR